MSDLIDRQAAIDATEIFIKDCNPEHFVGHPNFIEYMDSVGIQSFGRWQYANGFNMGLTAAEVVIKKLPSAQSEVVRCKDCKHRYGKACDFADFWLKDDDYCSRGERKEDGIT